MIIILNDRQVCMCARVNCSSDIEEQQENKKQKTKRPNQNTAISSLQQSYHRRDTYHCFFLLLLFIDLITASLSTHYRITIDDVQPYPKATRSLQSQCHPSRLLLHSNFSSHSLARLVRWLTLHHPIHSLHNKFNCQVYTISIDSTVISFTKELPQDLWYMDRELDCKECSIIFWN